MPLTVVEDQPLNLGERLEQDKRMRRVLVDMQLLMYGNAMKWESSFSSGKPSGGERPPGEAHPLHTEWQQRYVLAHPHDREQVIADATDALIAARVRTTPIPVGETDEQRDERMIAEGEGFEARVVAVNFNTGTSHVVKVRRRFLRDPNTGYQLPDQPTAKELALRGMSARQIALALGCSPGTAQYHVNKVRKAA